MADLASQPTDLAHDPTDAELAPPDTVGAPTAAAAAADSSGPATDDLLGELARAMHVAATSQYERMNAELERRRTEQVEAIAARASAEADSLKASLEADIGAIDAWAKAETEKIKRERLQRIDARREHLATQLERQETIKQREIFAIEVAIDAHRTEIDQFFGRMERETDPAAIAQVASSLPPFPSLAEIADAARRGVAAEIGAPDEAPPDALVSETRLMAVMDPDVTHGERREAAPSWEPPYVVSVAAGSGAADPLPEPEAHTSVGSTLLRTVRAIRPMAGSDKENPER